MAYDFDLFVIGAGSGGCALRALPLVLVQKWQWLKAVTWAAPVNRLRAEKAAGLRCACGR